MFIFGGPHVSVKDGNAAQKKAATDECMEKLNEAWAGITKAQKAAAGLAGRGEVLLDDATTKFKATYHELVKCMEATESLNSDLSFLIRFKKTKDQQQLSVPLAQKVLRMVASNLQDLVDSSKSLKALLPSNKKE